MSCLLSIFSAFLLSYRLQSLSSSSSRVKKYSNTQNVIDVTWINSDEVEQTRLEVVQIIEENWYEVISNLPISAMEACENELKGSMALLVLAALNKAAESDQESKFYIEYLFRAADGNNDGELTFLEWYDWLGSSPNITGLKKSSSDYFRRSSALMMTLKHVLGFAVSSINLMGRFTTDPSLLVASFIAGGMSSGNIQNEFAKALVGKLQAESR